MVLADLLTDFSRESVRTGGYSLVLGAGSSIGAASRDGRPLPKGNEFADEVATAFGLLVPKGTPLPYVWEAASSKVDSEATLRARTTVPRFRGCTPADYHDLFPSFAWRRIFTFNVDDVLPSSYERCPRRLQRATPIHFDQDYAEAAPLADEV